MDNYKITILGPSGAGKTIFIASLHKMLSTYEDKYGFFLSVDDGDRKVLNQIYTQLGTGKTGESLSTGTTITKELKFEVCVKNRNLDNIPVCQLTYKDYRGGQVTDVNANGEDDNLNLAKEIKNSDAVWVIIDGQKTLAFMGDENFNNNKVTEFGEKHLTGMMQLIDKNANRETTVNFLISKWDVIEKTYSLSEISNRLQEKVRDFKKVVNNRKNAGCSLYLIPVSSVGIDFVTLQPDGTIQKNSGRIPKPLWVEVPLIFFLVNKLESQVEELKPQINSKHNYIVYIVFGFAVLVCIISSLNLTVGIIMLIIMGLLYLRITSYVRDKRNKNKDKYNAMENMLEQCEKQKDEFLDRFPYSRL